MIHSIVRKIDVIEAQIKDATGSLPSKSEVSKVEKETLLSLPNPNYEAGHLIFGTSDYTKIKVQVMPRVRQPGNPVAELTHFGWVLMSPGKEVETKILMRAKTVIDHGENLYRLDVLCNKYCK